MADHESFAVSVGRRIAHVSLERARHCCPHEAQRYEEVRQRAYQKWQTATIDMATARELEASRRALLQALAEVLSRERPAELA